jgi:hypothetical protein
MLLHDAASNAVHYCRQVLWPACGCKSTLTVAPTREPANWKHVPALVDLRLAVHLHSIHEHDKSQVNQCWHMLAVSCSAATVPAQQGTH